MKISYIITAVPILYVTDQINHSKICYIPSNHHYLCLSLPIPLLPHETSLPVCGLYDLFPLA